MTSPLPLSLPPPTPSLILRPYAESDRAETLRLMGDEETGRFLLAFPRVGEAADASFAMRLASGVVGEGIERLQLAVIERTGGRFIGEICLINIDHARREGELGYMLVQDARGRGYATEAARTMLGLAFETLGLHRVIAICDDRNTASWWIMEKLGMRREAHFLRNVFLKGAWASSLVYAMLEEEWRARIG